MRHLESGMKMGCSLSLLFIPAVVIAMLQNEQVAEYARELLELIEVVGKVLLAGGLVFGSAKFVHLIASHKK
jgi:hypothetical protein